MNAVLSSDSPAANADGVLDVFVVRQFTIDHDRTRTAPLHRTRTIGGHVRASDYSATCPPALYRACSRDLMAFSMEDLNGRFVRISFEDALNNSARFGGNGALSNDHGDLAKAGSAFDSRANLQDDDFIDMFLYRGVDGAYKPVQVLGQMDGKRALPYDVLRSVAESMIARQQEALTEEDRQAIDTGKKLVDRLYGKTLRSHDFSFLVASASQPVNAVGGVPVVTTGVELPANYEPAGFGSAVGLFSLASQAHDDAVQKIIAPEVLGTAVRFSEAIDKYLAVTERILGDNHPLFTGDIVDEHTRVEGNSVAARRQNIKNAIASNLIDSAKAPLVYVGNTAAATSAASPLATPVYSGSSVEQESALDAIRAAVAPHASERVSAALATRSAADAFLASYERSSFAEAYAKSLGEKDARAATDKSFGLLAATRLTALTGGDHARAAAGILDGLIESMEVSRTLQPKNVDSALRRWATAGMSATTVQAAAAAAQPTTLATSAAATMTRLVVDPARLVGNRSFAVANPFRTNDGKALDTNNVHAAFDSRTHAHRAFAMSATPLWEQSAPLAGNKRMFSGALPEDAETRPGAETGLGLAAGYFKTALTKITRTAAFNKLWTDIGKESLLMSTNLYLLALLPVTSESLKSLHRANVRVPVDILIEQPFMTWEAASAIFISEAPNFALLAWAKFNVMLAPNMANQTLTGMMSIWFAAIPLHEDRFMLLEDCMVTGYRGGQDFRPIKPGWTPREGISKGSAFFFLVPYGSLRGERGVPRVHDIRGRFSSDLLDGGRLTPAAAHDEAVRPHYPSAPYYSHLFKFDQLRSITADAADYFHRKLVYDNTITFQHAQRIFDLTTGLFTRGILNTGHQGKNIADGYGAIVAGGRNEFIKEIHHVYAPED